MNKQQIVDKVRLIFEKAPFLKNSKNIVNITISGMKPEEGLQWCELYELVK